jgi:preprotein translocase subunit SecA
MMRYLDKFLGLSVGCLQNDMDSVARKFAYSCDITYGTASEFGFGYLRDNRTTNSAEEQVQRDHFFA